jgi:hypothetical protein
MEAAHPHIIMKQESSTMTHRYTLAAVLLAALSIPAAAQQTTQPDTSKKATAADTASKAGVSGTTTSTSNGSIADPANPADSTSGVTTSPGATVTSPAPTTPSATMTPSPATPSAGASVTAPAPSGASVTAPAPSGASSMSPSGANASSGANAAAPSGATGQVQPTSGVAKVDGKGAPSLANTVKISADSAFALAKASPDAGEISSAELEMTDHRLVYQVKMVKGAGASTVYVDAMTGEVVKDKKFGGLKAAAENQEESQKLYEAKKDSAEAKKP